MEKALTHQQHPLSAAFPAMSPDEYQGLKDSIETIGVKNPITMFEGMVLDGWNRYRAALEVGMPCPSQDLTEGDDPREFVLAQNKNRRHILQAQMAMAVIAVHDWRPLGDQRSATVDTECPPSKSAAELAQIAGVHASTIKQAKAVQTRGSSEVRDAVKSGVMGLPKAAAIARLPADQQAAAIAAPMPKPAKFKGKAKKVPAVKLVNAEIKAAEATKEADEAAGRVADLEREVSVLREQLVERGEDLASVAKVLDASDQLAAALAEAKEARDLARGYKDRINSMTTQIADLKRSVAHWEKKARAGT